MVGNDSGGTQSGRAGAGARVLISVFARLGGGNLHQSKPTSAADLVGKKIESGPWRKDDPAPIRPRSRDNVGDKRGRLRGKKWAADVFETYAVSLIGAIFSRCADGGKNAPAAIVYPFRSGRKSRLLGAICGILSVKLRRR